MIVGYSFNINGNLILWLIFWCTPRFTITDCSVLQKVICKLINESTFANLPVTSANFHWNLWLHLLHWKNFSCVRFNWFSQCGHLLCWCIWGSVTCKKLSNVYKSCPKLISLEKLKILTPLQKLPKNVRDLGKLIVTQGFKKLPKVQ